MERRTPLLAIFSTLFPETSTANQETGYWRPRQAFSLPRYSSFYSYLSTIMSLLLQQPWEGSTPIHTRLCQKPSKCPENCLVWLLTSMDLQRFKTNRLVWFFPFLDEASSIHMETFFTITPISEVILFLRIFLKLFANLLCYINQQCFLSTSFLTVTYMLLV